MLFLFTPSEKMRGFANLFIQLHSQDFKTMVMQSKGWLSVQNTTLLWWLEKVNNKAQSYLV